MRRTVLILAAILCLPVPAAAQQGPRRAPEAYDIELGGKYVFLYEEGGYSSPAGVLIEGGYGIWTFGRWRLHAIAEIMFAHFDDLDATYKQIAGGARAGTMLSPRIRAFGQLQIGVQNDGLSNSATGMVLMPGAGVNYAVLTWLDAQATVDFPFARYENGTFGQVRTSIGVTVPLGGL
jgi:hypothetical protein